MTDKAIAELANQYRKFPTLANPATDDWLIIVDNSTGQVKKITHASLVSFGAQVFGNGVLITESLDRIITIEACGVVINNLGNLVLSEAV